VRDSVKRLNLYYYPPFSLGSRICDPCATILDVILAMPSGLLLVVLPTDPKNTYWLRLHS
jgi:hypothetical protein